MGKTLHCQGVTSLTTFYGIYFCNVTSDWITTNICNSISCDILLYSLTSLIMSHFIGRHAALCSLKPSNIRRDCKSPLEWELLCSKISMGRYIVGYMVQNHVLLLRLDFVLKLNFGTYIPHIPPQMKGVLAIRRIFSLVDMITKPKFSNCPNIFKIGLFP